MSCFIAILTFVQRLKLDLGHEMGLGLGLFRFPQHSK